MMQDYAAAKTVNFSEIPIISVSGLRSEGGIEKLAEAVFSAASQVGFFYLIDHQVPKDLRQRAFAASQRFFACPQQQKETIAVNQDQRGWMAKGLTRLEGSHSTDAKEVFFWGMEPDVEYLARNHPMVAPNQWPDDICPSLREDLLPYYVSVLQLGDVILSALAVGLGKSADFFTPYYTHGLARGQLVCYPPSLPDDADALRFGAAAHSDFGVLTLLAQDDIGGLQVLNKSENWIEAPPIDNSFVCNIGDLLERWTNGKLVSTLHRVINRSDKTRYSLPIFHDPSSHAMIDPAEFISDGVEAHYSAISAGEYIASRNRNNFLHYQKK